MSSFSTFTLPKFARAEPTRRSQRRSSHGEQKTEQQPKSTDVWFTQDALDADNLPATRAVAEYCTKLMGQGQFVRLFLDVSTAHRDLSLPRVHSAPYNSGTAYGAGKKGEPDGITAEKGFAVEEMNGTWYGFMGNRYYVDDAGQLAELEDVQGKPGAKKAVSLSKIPDEIKDDSLKCNEYDAMVLHSVAKTYFPGTIHVIGGNLSRQQLWDKVVPNTFLMTKSCEWEAEGDVVAAALESDVVVGRSVKEYEKLLEKLDSQDSTDYELVNATVTITTAAGGKEKKNIKQWRYTPDAVKETARRSRMRAYINKHVAEYKLKNTSYKTVTVDAALNALAACRDRCLEVVICAPMDNVKRVLAEHAKKVRNVVGEFGSLRVSDNIVGAQWNEFLDSEEPLQSAHQAFASMREADYPVFFTPTQMFKKGGFPSVEAVFKEINDAAKGSNGSNLFLSYQECWNTAKRGPQAIFDPLCVIAKYHGLFDAKCGIFAKRANIPASSAIFGPPPKIDDSDSDSKSDGKSDGSGGRTFSCPAYTVNGDVSTATAIKEEQHIEFDAQNVDIITTEYLRLYDLKQEHGSELNSIGLGHMLYETGAPANSMLVGTGELTRGLVLQVKDEQRMGAPSLTGRFKLTANHQHADNLIQEHFQSVVTTDIVQNMRIALTNTKSKSFENLRSALLKEIGVHHNAELLNTHLFHPSQWTAL